MTRTYWTTKPNNVIRYETVTFQHPDIDPVRLVANQYEATILGCQWDRLTTKIPAQLTSKHDVTQHCRITLVRAAGNGAGSEIDAWALAQFNHAKRLSQIMRS